MLQSVNFSSVVDILVSVTLLWLVLLSIVPLDYVQLSRYPPVFRPPSAFCVQPRASLCCVICLVSVLWLSEAPRVIPGMLL